MNFKKVEDHDHYTGMSRGAAHSLCIRINFDDNNIYTRCKSCTKRSKQSIGSLIEKFPNTYQ